MAEEMEAEKPSFFTRIRAYLTGADKEEGEETYKRKLFDSRIEKYLDHHASQYIAEFGLITSLNLEAYNERYEDLTMRIKSLQDFARDADAEVASLEKRIDIIKSASKTKKK
jgi:hypothetical protein